MYIGDGNVFTSNQKGIYRIRWYLSTRGKEIEKRLTKILEKLNLQVRKYEEKDNTLIIETHSKEFLEWLSSVASKDGIKMNVHSAEFLRGVIEGLIDSDGYVKRNYAEITTSNHKLKENIISILKTLKIRYNVRTYVSPLSSKIGWRIGFSLNCKCFNPVKWSSSGPQTAR